MAVVGSQLRATPITVRWVALALVLVGGTALTVGTLSYARARAALVTTADTRLELLGRDVAQGLYRKLMGHAADITTWARLETTMALTFGDVDKELATLLHETIGTDEAYVALLGLDRDGRPVAVAGDPGRFSGADPAAAATGMRLTIVSDATGPSSLLRFDTPVLNPRRPEERIGTLVAILDPRPLLRGISADRLQHDATTVVLTAGAETLATAGAPADGADAMLATRVAVPPLRGLEAPAFAVDVRQATHTALASVTALRTTLVRTGIVVVLLSGIAGGLFAWRLSVPIRRLTASVEGIAARGQPEAILGLPRAGGEVGVLTDAFNTMLQRLAIAQREVVAQSRLALLGEIAASIVHDVRTPLSVLKTSAQLLGSAGLSVAEQRDLAGMIASEADRLNRVVTHLADLGRAHPPNRTRQAVQALVERTVSVLRPWARTRRVTIEGRGDPDLYVPVDTDQLLQTLLNVVHNAAQASPPDGRVTIHWHAQPPWVAIEVTDTGPGFSPDALERAFSPFFTTKLDGTGLGLAIAKRIIEAHDGEIGVRNGDRGGACVWIRLPLDA